MADCQHLGPLVGRQVCEDCLDKGRRFELHVYACHAGHGEVTINRCGTHCPQYQPKPQAP